MATSNLPGYRAILKIIQQWPREKRVSLVQAVLRGLEEPPKTPATLSKAEADLLLKINEGLPTDLQQRYRQLAASRDRQELTPEEHAELLALTAKVENLEVRRLENLIVLSQLRQVSLNDLMKQLEIHPPADE